MVATTHSPTRAVSAPGPAQEMTFAQALDTVAQGASITKLEWDNPSTYGMLRNNILMLRRDGEWFQWIINEGDILGEDWVIRAE